MPNSQRGFLMPVAIFILIVLAGLTITLSRFGSQTGSSVVQEAMSVAAFFAAESGGQYAFNQMFYSTTLPPSRALAATRCNSLSGQTVTFAAAGLANCTAQLTCVVTHNVADTQSFYRIESRGECGSPPLYGIRTIEMASQLQGLP